MLSAAAEVFNGIFGQKRGLFGKFKLGAAGNLRYEMGSERQGI
jgi:hypothetical protein